MNLKKYDISIELHKINKLQTKIAAKKLKSIFPYKFTIDEYKFEKSDYYTYNLQLTIPQFGIIVKIFYSNKQDEQHNLSFECHICCPDRGQFRIVFTCIDYSSYEELIKVPHFKKIFIENINQWIHFDEHTHDVAPLISPWFIGKQHRNIV